MLLSLIILWAPFLVLLAAPFHLKLGGGLESLRAEGVTVTWVLQA